MNAQVKSCNREIVYSAPVMKDYAYGWKLYRKYKRISQDSYLTGSQYRV